MPVTDGPASSPGVAWRRGLRELAGGVHRRRAVRITYDIPGGATGLSFYGLSFYVVADADQNGDGIENECLEDNDGAGVDDVTCPDLN